MLIVGYLTDWPDHFIVRNSWGNAWGIAGYCMFPVKYLCSSEASDLRTIVRAT